MFAGRTGNGGLFLGRESKKSGVEIKTKGQFNRKGGVAKGGSLESAGKNADGPRGEKKISSPNNSRRYTISPRGEDTGEKIGRGGREKAVIECEGVGQEKKESNEGRFSTKWKGDENRTKGEGKSQAEKKKNHS